MDDEVTRILSLAKEYPALGIDALRAAQIANECAQLRQACALASERFSADPAGQFAALYRAADPDAAAR